MTRSSTSGTDGQGEGPILTGSNVAISPGEFASACEEIVRRHGGDEAHRRLDHLVTRLLCSLGYSEGMQIFLTAVTSAHPGEAA